jgi:SAM-dependent methyltransferase
VARPRPGERILGWGEQLLPARSRGWVACVFDRFTDGWEGLSAGDGRRVPPWRLRLRAGRFLRPEQYLRSGREFFELVGPGLGGSGLGEVLEIGCGPGRIAAALRGGTVPWKAYEGMDIAEEPVAWAERYLGGESPRMHFSSVDVRNRHYARSGSGPAERLEFPYASGRFDTVLAVSVFTHMLPDAVERYLAESHRVLRPGGRLLASFYLVCPGEVEGAGNADPPLRPSPSGDSLWERADDPEAFVGLWEDDLRRRVVRAGWSSAPTIRHGTWLAGRPLDPALARAGFRQDLVILERPVD